MCFSIACKMAQVRLGFARNPGIFAGQIEKIIEDYLL